MKSFLVLFPFVLLFSIQLVSGSCPIVFPNPPASPTVAGSWTIPAQSYGNTYGGSTAVTYNTGGIVSTTATTSTVKAYQWNTEQIIWMSTPVAGFLPDLQTNRVSFNMSALATNRWTGTAATPSTLTFSMDIVVVQNIVTGANGNDWIISWGDSDLWKKGTCGSPCKVLFKTTVTGVLNTNKLFFADWVQTHAVPGSTARLVVRLRSGFTPTTANNQYTISSLTLTRSAKARAFAGLLTSPSQVVVIKEMPVLGAGNFTQQVDCPHLQSGLKLWHDAATWAGAGVPQPNGAAFSLPANTKVLIDSCTFSTGYPTTPYGTITIPSTSQLIIGEGVAQLLVTNIVVQGRLLVGGPTCRLKSKLTITFHNSAVDLGGACGRKTLCVQSTGQLDIHGKLFDATWSRLAFSVLGGDDRIALQSAVNWEVGQRIVVTSTTWDNTDSTGYEIRTIKAVQGKYVQVDSPFSRYHFAGIGYQAEAILLDRRVTLQGDAVSATNYFGGHVIAAGVGAQMRLRGVKGFRMGQKNVLARYPFHFHMIKAAVNSYITDCSVENSYYRCYTIHGTNNTRLSRNTAYDNIGHCYYIEDGVEENNIIEYNIAAFQRPLTAVAGVATKFNVDGSQTGITVEGSSILVIPADIAAGGFYITNSFNTFTGNAASGGFAGFSFVNLPAPIGAHRGLPGLLSPQERPLKSFQGNTVHSTSWQWHSSACVYIGGKLWYKNATTPNLTYNVGRNSRSTRTNTGTPVWFRLDNVQAGNCQMGLNHWGDRLELVNFEVSDTQRSAQIFGTSWMDNVFINTYSTNPTLSKPRLQYEWTQVENFQFYDTWSQAIITRVTFKNMQRPTDWGITAVEYSDVFKPQGIAASRDIKWVNSLKQLWVHHQTSPVGSSRYFNIMDFDNSINNGTSKVRTLIGAHDSEYFVPGNTASTLIFDWWKIRGDCVPGHDAWNVTICPVVDWRYQVASINVKVNEYIKDNMYYSPTDYAGIMTRWSTGAKTIITRNPIITGPIGPKIGWFMWLKKGTPHKFSIDTFSIPYVDGKGYTSLPFAVSYPKGLQASYFKIEVADQWAKANGYSGKNVTVAASAAAVYTDNTGKKFFYDSATGYLYLNLIADYNPQGWGGAPSNFIRGGATLFDRCNSAYYITLNSCPGCSIATSDNGINYYTPGTLTPPSNAVLPA